jgi:polyisoprenoid-binding protein YceI
MATVAVILIVTMVPVLAVRKTEEAQRSPATLRFRLDATRSKFIAHGLRGGLLWFKGHEHLIAARDFTGEAQVTPGVLSPASLQITVDAATLAETSDEFTEQQKQIINKELREIVFEPEKYPQIVFRSTRITGQTVNNNNNSFEVKIRGDLTLHGVTRSITIPARVSVAGDELRATGEFSIDRGDFNVKATSAFHGLVRVRKKVKFTFDIVGLRY